VTQGFVAFLYICRLFFNSCFFVVFSFFSVRYCSFPCSIFIFLSSSLLLFFFCIIFQFYVIYLPLILIFTCSFAGHTSFLHYLFPLSSILTNYFVLSFSFSFIYLPFFIIPLSSSSALVYCPPPSFFYKNTKYKAPLLLFLYLLYQ
jgi:hypothetical protein